MTIESDLRDRRNYNLHCDECKWLTTELRRLRAEPSLILASEYYPIQPKTIKGVLYGLFLGLRLKYENNQNLSD